MNLSRNSTLIQVISLIFVIVFACQKGPTIVELQPEISLLQTEYSQSKARLAQIKKENSELKQKLVSLQESYTLLQNSYQEEFLGSRELQKQIDELKELIQQVIEENLIDHSKKTSELNQLREKIASNSNTVESLKENRKLVAQINDKLKVIEQSQSQLEGLQTKIKALQLDLDKHLEVQNQFQNTEKEYLLKIEELIRLEQQVEDTQLAYEKIINTLEINELNQQVARMRSNIGQIQEAQSNLKELNSQIKKLTSYSKMLPELKMSLEQVLESELSLRLKLADLRQEFYSLTGISLDSSFTPGGPFIRIENKVSQRFFVGDTHRLTYKFVDKDGITVDPVGAVVWTSSNERIVFVNQISGEIKAISKGTSRITVSTQIGNRRYTDQYSIDVLNLQNSRIEIVENLPSQLLVNQKHHLEYVFYNQRNQQVEQPRSKLTWKSSNEEIIKIDSNTGVITTVATGSSVISLSITIDGKSITNTVTITVSSGNEARGRVEIVENLPDPFLVGQTHRFTFHYFDSQGDMTTPPAGTAVWTSSKNRNARPNANNSGDVTAERAGAATITLTYTLGSNSSILTDTYDIMVIQGPQIRIIENIPSDFAVPDTHTLTYNYWNASGQKVPPPNGIRWKSETKTVARIDPSTGLVTAKSKGTTVITITTQESNKNNRIRDTYRIEVQTNPEFKIIDLPPGSSIAINGTHDLDVEYYDNTGTKTNLPQGTTVTWASSDQTKITVNASSGVITGVATGTSNISASATINGVSVTGSVTITVSAGSLRNDGSKIEIQEDLPDFFFVGQSHTFTIKYYNSSNTQTSPPAGSASWTASNNRITFSSTNIGEGTGAGQGVVTITARYTFDSDASYLEDTYRFRVTQGPIVRITENIPSGFKKGDTHTLTADYYNASGQKVNHPDGLSWTGNADTVATIDQNTGLVTAVGPGTVTFTVTTKESNAANRVTDTYRFNVLTNPEFKIIDLPPGSSIAINGTHDLDVEYYDNTGTKTNLPQGTTVTWASSDQTKITVNASSGVITGVATGTSNISASATINGVSVTGSVTITVSSGTSVDPKVEIVENLPDPFLVGQTHRFTFHYFDSQGDMTTPPAGTAVWTSSKNRNARPNANNSGDVTAGRAGEATITLTYTISGSSTILTDTYDITVIQGPQIRIIEDIPSNFAAPNTHKLTYNYWNASGQKVTPHSIRWKSKTKTVATIEKDSGLVTAVSAGTTEITVTARGQNREVLARDTRVITVN